MIGIYGGSFDPPHIGHLGVIQSFWKIFPDCKTLFLVPNFISPFKKAKGAKEEDILAMIGLLILEANLNNTLIEEFEIRKQSTSYTIDTIQYFREKFKEEEIYLLLGIDNLKDFSSWKNFERILENAKILIFDRQWDKDILMPPELNNFKSRFLFIKNSPIQASSSEIRKLSMGEWASYLSPKVLDYIKEKELYGYRKGN